MRWEGSSDESKGIAIITVKGVECRVPLKSFADFLIIQQAIDQAYESGKNGTVDRVKRLIGRMFKQNFGECE